MRLEWFENFLMTSSSSDRDEQKKITLRLTFGSSHCYSNYHNLFSCVERQQTISLKWFRCFIRWNQMRQMELKLKRILLHSNSSSSSRDVERIIKSNKLKSTSYSEAAGIELPSTHHAYIARARCTYQRIICVKQNDCEKLIHTS